jgi:hypothetical protein
MEEYALEDINISHWKARMPMDHGANKPASTLWSSAKPL